jgi:signal peptidase I
MSEITGLEPTRTNRARIAREIALTLGAVIGLVCIVVAAAALLFGITPLIVRSGSMEPTIPTGALAIAKDLPGADIKPGDVISVDNQQGIRITHRVVSVDSISKGAAAVTLKGDANGVPDSQPYVITSAKRVVFHVDGLGYAIAWLNTPAAMAIGALIVAALIWIMIFPKGRKRPSRPRHDTDRPAKPKPKHAAGVAPSLIVFALATTVVIGFGHVHGTAAAYTSSATATTGSFASRATFVPRINGFVSGGIYTTCATSGTTFARVVTINWSHIGPPYQYRIILRDLSGNVWRTIDVVPPAGSVAGSTMSATFGATGFPERFSQWDYDAEIHTMLPGGVVSPDWRGERVYQDAFSAGRENMSCRFIAASGTETYVPPPASISCVTNTVPKTATVSWPHVATGYSYRLTVRNPTTGNIAYTTSVTTGTPVGQPVSATITYNNLTAGILTSTAATVEIRSQAANATQSTGFVSYQLTVTSSSTTVACAGVGASALRVAPTTAPTTSSTTTTAPAPPQSTTATTPPSTTSPPTTSTSTTSAAPTTTAATTTTVPTTPAEQPLSPASNSSSGNYSAQLMQTATGPAVIIRDASGVETYRTPAAPDDTLQWGTGADELRVTGSSGAWTISRTTGGWTKTPYVEAPATTSATTSP